MGVEGMRRINLGFLLVLAGLLVRSGPVWAEDEQPAAETIHGDAEAFFEARVRPVLAEQCWKCHGDAKQSSGLRLDSREAMLEGGGEGPAIIPGRPDESPLIRAVRHEGEIRMPPKGKLPETAIRDLADWVRRGAPWPKGHTAKDSKAEAAQQHWAFQPVRQPDLPVVQDTGWIKTPVDAFILAQLEAAGLHPSERADKRTLIRRASFDLIGLPPTPEEIEAFEQDEAPDAYEQLVERLLASPHYGERWGRHWLDIARYADTKGYVFQEERKYPYSYTYRDYVIAAFNEDKPYDRFLVEQIAADRLPRGDARALAALGFLTVGRRFLNNNEDIIDDRIDVVTRGLLGLTVACARCHDHKYDPIPTEDYYSLYGVFASSFEPKDLPLLPTGRASPAQQEYETERAKRKTAVESFVAETREALQKELRTRVAEYLLAAYDLGYNPKHPKYDETARAEKLRPELLRHWMTKWKERLNATRDGRDPLLAPWHAFAALPEAEFAARAAEVAEQLAPPAEASGAPERTVARTIAGTPPGSMREVVQRYGELFLRAQGAEVTTDPAVSAARALLDAADGPFAIAMEELPRVINRAERDRYRALERQVVELDANHPGAPPRAMVLN
ncbi:MAG: DUF1549 domain-containing protein, partial [Isosphaeraceae bacterium]|nr:DUF1549 domain-containing protein [Isosphaeraceae bacterium]